MKKKIIICSIFALIMTGLFSGETKALGVTFHYVTITFKNIDLENDNIFILINKEDYEYNHESYPAQDPLQIVKSDEDEIKKVAGINLIEEQYKNNQYQEGLLDTHEEIIYNNKKYYKIKIIGNCNVTSKFHIDDYIEEDPIVIKTTISSPITCVKIFGDNIEKIINDYEESTDQNISKYYKVYHINRKGYGGDTVGRRFFEFDAKTNEIKNVTNEKIKIEEKKVKKYVKKQEIKNTLEQKSPYFIIVGLCFLWLIGLLFFSIKRKKV